VPSSNQAQRHKDRKYEEHNPAKDSVTEGRIVKHRKKEAAHTYEKLSPLENPTADVILLPEETRNPKSQTVERLEFTKSRVPTSEFIPLNSAPDATDPHGSHRQKRKSAR
jgi:hypothetical protein